MKNHKINIRFVSPGLRLLGANKPGFNLIIFHFDIRRKLSIIQCDKYILLNTYLYICEVFFLHKLPILHINKTEKIFFTKYFLLGYYHLNHPSELYSAYFNKKKYGESFKIAASPIALSMYKLFFFG